MQSDNLDKDASTMGVGGMDIGGIGAFVAVYECGSINKAASRLYMSPQGLSKAIARFEGEVAAPLFTRSHQGVEPTMYARALYPKAKDMLAVLDEMRTNAGEAPVYHPLKVALSNGTVALLGLEFIDAFEAENPGVELVVSECSDQAIQEQLAAGDVELGMLIGPVDDVRFSASFLMSTPHVLMVSDQSPLALKDAIDYTDLNGLAVCMLGSDYPVMRNLQQRLADAGATPARLVGIAGADTVVHSVVRNEVVNVSALPWAHASVQPGLKLVPFADPMFVWTVYLAQRRGAQTSEAARAFSTFIGEWVAQTVG